MRILSKGNELPFVHRSIGWDESTNFKDFDIVFVNLRTLEKESHKYDHPYNDSENSPKIFQSSDVSEFIKEDGHMVIYLPESPITEMGDTTTVRKDFSYSSPSHQARAGSIPDPEPYCEYDLLRWLPCTIKATTDESGKSIDVFLPEWDWYFGTRFAWNKFLKVSRTAGYDKNTIAENSYGKIISIEMNKNGGSLKLIPPTDSITYSEFVRNTLENVFGVESNVEGRSPPSWVSDYSLPSEEDTKSSIERKESELTQLKEELESITKFKRLLYETHTNLEDVTKEALREIGFTVDGEVPGKRDGILHTSHTKFALEVTGTTGGIKLKKCRQLDEWVENAVVEFPNEDVSGLLIVNPEMNTSPDNREVSVEPNVEGYMKRRGDYKILTTPDLYRIVELCLEGKAEKDVIEEMFYQEDTLLELPPEFSQ
ncbi:hypothetical protein SAMN04488063_0996 [Halopelagius inordinatus]|uniref:Restriction endonuclease n=1 Tax=Halopelagius inordinatus TaxID=553467 RepID=A0A1I2N1I7_9EURY|nr:hypothetical protein [Halopelagius inordinatus]SFF97612.1 hypothetical protein SAMN04488063_0996 [Halopelagius inordinatus]